MSSRQRTGVAVGITRWWRTSLSDGDFLSVLRRFLTGIRQFAWDSLPSRRRQRYGDVDYDWDYRVDTTGATVSWRDRLLGTLHSPYQPTEPALFRQMLGSLRIDFRAYTFIDLGSGKGRTLLMASDYPFKRIVGVELLDSLHQVALQNIAKYRSDSQQCFRLESVCADATQFEFPSEPIVLYLFNPLPKSGLAQVIERLERALRDNPRQFVVLYHNPEYETMLLDCPALERCLKTKSCAIFTAKH